ncbi:MAG: 6-phosphofructokinase [Candidatus Merdivicinus sp.]|jgi:6-phosphofructokinase 1
MSVKTIGVLTSGGDAPGMNAAIRSVVRSALKNDMKVLGVMRGYNGLINGDMVEMNMRSVSDIIQRGGTMLYTARCKEFKEMAGVLKAKEVCQKVGMDGLVVIGGDGSFRGAGDLSSVGVPCVGIPGTIDNDIACTEYTIGYDTAMNTAMRMVDMLRDTAQSHERCSVVEVMGRRAGYIALNAGIACGATFICVPEIGLDMDQIVEKIQVAHKLGKKHFIIMVAEGIGNVKGIAEEIYARTGIESRETVLGHVQRGGNPTVTDRVTASRMGYHAVELLRQGIGNRVVAQQKGAIVDYDIQEALAMKKEFPIDLYNIANDISF